MKRPDGRKVNQLRKVKITKNYIKNPEGCCLIEFGDTKVICTASVEDRVPSFLKGKGTGWVTAEYGMLPRSCNSRIKRDRTSNSGRSQEIQRLIGRSLRSIVDMDQLGERTIKIDCDVLQGDGGTRTASITGGFIALALALKHMKKIKMIKEIPLKGFVAAISVGIFEGTPILDLDYIEDSQAETDMNVVMLEDGNFVEIQGTAEGKAFSKKEMDALLDLAKKGITELFVMQKKVIGKL